ncbi:MAG: hypothetical protein Q4D06_07075 [Coriobacteriia bacterium]|nr:hypothetical protein [Coriobacteriia bacterium]
MAIFGTKASNAGTPAVLRALLCAALCSGLILPACTSASAPEQKDGPSAAATQPAASKEEQQKGESAAGQAKPQAGDESKADRTPQSIPGATDAETREAAQSVRGSLAGFAEKDPKVLKACLSEVGFDPNDYGISWGCFAQTYYRDFRFSVDSVDPERDGRGGIGVTFTIEVPVMTKVVKLMYDTNKAAVESGADARKKGHSDKAWRKAWKKAKVGTDKLSGTLYVLQGKNGSWELEDKAAFAALLMDGYDPRQV